MVGSFRVKTEEVTLDSSCLPSTLEACSYDDTVASEYRGLNGPDRFSAVTGDRTRVVLFPTLSGAVGLIGSSATSAGSRGWVAATGDDGSLAVLGFTGTVTEACALGSLPGLFFFGTGPLSCLERGTLRTGSTKVVRPLAPFQGFR